MNAIEKRARLAAQISNRELVIAPGVFEMISTLIADQQNHDALYMTGYGTVASYLGLPDAGLATFSDMINRATAIAARSRAPLVADADTGYGGLLNVAHTVKGYEAAGVAAIHIEDQVFPKKCGHTPDRRVIPAAEMVQKIKVAIASREDPNLLIIARTDARTGLGLAEAISRANAYREAGADMIFVEAPESEDEFAEIAKSVDAPLLANMVDGGRSPVLTAEQLREMGFALAIYPGVGMTAAAAALQASYQHLLAHGSSHGMQTPLYPVSEMHQLMGFESVWAFEKDWAE
ncbi:MAG: isocitrate lyase/PEP mutase family protein [Pseudomonadota bacterium]